MLGHVDAALRIEGDAFAVAQPGREALGWREMLVRLVGVVEPYAGTGLQLGARLIAGRAGIRFSAWQAFVAEPMSTYRLPVAPMLNGCIGWSPVSGMPERMVVGAPVGTISPGFRS